MTTPMFRFAKKNDDVWDLHLGWGKITTVKYAAPHGSYQFVANFTSKAGSTEKTYTIEGKEIKTGKQTAFTSQSDINK